MNKLKEKFRKNFKKFKREYNKDVKKGYAKGLSRPKLFLIFVVFSIFGNYYEQILNFVIHFLKDGSIFWEYRRGVIYGPFSPIYGAGAVLFTVLLLRKDLSNTKTFIYGGLIGGIFEYFIGFLQETFIGTTSWDYSGQFLNINGRTSVPIMLVWGLLALIYAKLIYPGFSKLIENAPFNFMKTITVFLAIFLTFDMTISWTALIRQSFRRKGYEPFTVVGAFYDKVYPDEVLSKYFPNMKQSDKK